MVIRQQINKESSMKKIITTLAVIGGVFICEPSFSGDHNNVYADTPEYKEIDNEVRTSLQKCLDNKDMMVKQCMKIAKKQLKYKKRALKQQMKNSSSMNN